MFRLSNEDWGNLKSQTGISSSPARSKVFLALRSQGVTAVAHGGRRGLPYAFTEQGVAMLSSVLHSPRAVEVNIE